MTMTMTVELYFSDVSKRVSASEGKNIQKGALGRIKGMFDPSDKKHYMPNFATPFSGYSSFGRFFNHSLELASSLLMAIPSLAIGVIAMLLTAAAVIITYMILSVTLPFGVIGSALLPGYGENRLVSVGKHLESASKDMICLSLDCSLISLGILLDTLRDVILIPTLQATTFVTKSATSIVEPIAKAAVAFKDYCLSNEPSESYYAGYNCAP